MAKVYGDPVAACPACDFPLGKQHPYAWCCNCGSPLPTEVTALLTFGPTASVRLRPSRILAVVMGCCAAVFLFFGVLLIALLGSEYEGPRLALAGLGTGFLAGAWTLGRSSMVALRPRADQRISSITFDPSVGWSLAWPDGYHVELGHRINGGMREDYLQVVGWSDREEEIEFAVRPELVGARNVAALALLLDNTPRYCQACRIAAPPAAAHCERCGAQFAGRNPRPADPHMTHAEMASTRQTYARLPTARLEELLQQCEELRPDAVPLLVEELKQRGDHERSSM